MEEESERKLKKLFVEDHRYYGLQILLAVVFLVIITIYESSFSSDISRYIQYYSDFDSNSVQVIALSTVNLTTIFIRFLFYLGIALTVHFIRLWLKSKQRA